jgi:hypothetical protein
MRKNISFDDYANSMFRFERLRPRWINLCSEYLRHVFGPTMEDATFLDYAFGRGNWSLAAVKAGAKQVIAIDASQSNVRRFSDYCRMEGIDCIEVIQGNVAEAPIQSAADILWIYGVLSSVADPDALLTSLAPMRRSNAALAVLYGYNRPSLRQVIVDLARRSCLYVDEDSFATDTFLFTPQARLRARDDLTAPVVLWFTADEFAELARRNGYTPLRWIPDFGGWQNRAALDEFAPHVMLCGFSGEANSPIAPTPHLGSLDMSVLATIGQTVMAAASIELRRKIAIGLFNTHFSALHGERLDERAVREDFLFLMHAVLRLDIPAATFPTIARDYVRAAHAATIDDPRGFPPTLLAHSPLAAFLDTNPIRL